MYIHEREELNGYRGSKARCVCLNGLVLLLPLALAAGGCATVSRQAPGNPEGAATQAAPNSGSEDNGPGVLHRFVFYAPNRILDVVDVFRLRARLGPGIAVGARATKAASGFIGTYAGVYAGLPGPRMRRIPRLPAGLESYNGVQVSVADVATGAGMGPGYSPTEFGAGAQLMIVGFDIGLDPYEILDFATGLVMIDLREDDW